MLTIEDIRNPARKSGFNYVNLNAPDRVRPAYRALLLRTATEWRRGPSRRSAEEAAQDYVDYINGIEC